MNNVLPLKSVWPEDQHLLGEEIANLARLRHLKLPVPDGLVVSPPREEIARVLDQYAKSGWSAVVKEKLMQLPPPEELSELVALRQVETKVLWRDLLEGWVAKLQRLIESGAKYPVKSLESKYCLFTGPIKARGKVFYDRANVDTEIVIDQGKLTPLQMKYLDEVVTKLQRKFLVDYIYEWIVDSELKFSRVLPYSEQILTDRGTAEIVEQPRITKERPKLATKLFWQQRSLVVDPGCDGVVIRASEVEPDLLRFEVVESSYTFKDKPVIVLVGIKGDEIGATESLAQKAKLERQIESVLWARNKQQLLNVSVGIPVCRSSEELKEFKRTLAAMGINRKASLKIWLEMGVPENFLRFEQYAMVGIDGVILNLDLLASCLTGLSVDKLLPSGDYGVVVKFLTTYLRAMVRLRIPIIADGMLLQNDQIVKGLIEVGVWGLAPHAANLDEVQLRVSKLESRVG